MDGLLDLGAYLQGNGISLMCGDFEEVFRHVDRRTDVIYADPPYMGQCGTYTAEDFSDHDHDRLNRLLNKSCVPFVLSNSQVFKSHTLTRTHTFSSLSHTHTHIYTCASLGSRSDGLLAATGGRDHPLRARAQHEQPRQGADRIQGRNARASRPREGRGQCLSP